MIDAATTKVTAVEGAVVDSSHENGMPTAVAIAKLYL